MEKITASDPPGYKTRSLTGSAVITIEGGSNSPLIGEVLAPDNKIGPPGKISYDIQDRQLVFRLESFERIESLQKTVIDILESVKLVEEILLVVANTGDNQK